MNQKIKHVEKVVAEQKAQIGDLKKYKDEEGIDLNRSYFELFNDIKEISFYYHVVSVVKILGAKDLAGIDEFSRPSQYKGIRCVDIICRINLKDFNYDKVIDLAEKSKGEDKFGYRTEFVNLVRSAKNAPALAPLQ